MTRFFYKPADRLAAAWMMERHGMRLVTPSGEELRWYDGKLMFGVPYPHEGGVLEGRTLLIESLDLHFIHPDSLHLLEPQPDDLVLYAFREEWRHSYVASNQDQPPGRLRLEGCVAIDSKDARIIQRNGLAFHWPEREG